MPFGRKFFFLVKLLILLMWHCGIWILISRLPAHLAHSAHSAPNMQERQLKRSTMFTSHIAKFEIAIRSSSNAVFPYGRFAPGINNVIAHSMGAIGSITICQSSTAMGVPMIERGWRRFITSWLFESSIYDTSYALYFDKLPNLHLLVKYWH